MRFWEENIFKKYENSLSNNKKNIKKIGEITQGRKIVLD